jgi:cation/acetate symporter
MNICRDEPWFKAVEGGFAFHPFLPFAILHCGLGRVAILLGSTFERQNVAYLVALTFSIAASSNFPILVTAMFWRALTTRGALAGGYVGLLGSVILVTLGPTVWGKIRGMGAALFPIDMPTIITLPAAVIVAWLVSKADNSVAARNERLAFDDEYIRLQTGLGAEGAAVH